MFERHRIVCVTPAGRRRYLRTLIPYILQSTLVDEYQLWLNTRNPLDAAFIRACPSLDPRIRVIEPADHQPDGNNTIGQFFRDCIDTDTIYIRFDDDIVYLEPGFFEALLRFRISNPEYFLVAPFVANNPLCTYLLTALGIVTINGPKITANAFDPIAWKTPEFARTFHRMYLDLVRTGNLADWRFGAREIALNRFGINCISWFGREFATFGGVVPFGDEEEWLTVWQPARLGRRNCFFGGTSVAHFAYGPQRAMLDRSGLLAEYEAVAATTLGDSAARICASIWEDLPVTRSVLEDRRWRTVRSNGEELGTMQLRPDGTIQGDQKTATDRWTLAGSTLLIISAEWQVKTRIDTMERDADGRVGMQGPVLLAPESPDVILIEAAPPTEE
jgi:hypothetical protein